MRNKHYNKKSLRVSEEEWERFKELRHKSGLSWNLFIKRLNDENRSTETGGVYLRG